MCKKYTQWTMKERYMIEWLIQANKTQHHISERLGRDKSTVYRELARNKDDDGLYCAEKAAVASRKRCKRVRFRKFTEPVKSLIEEKLIIHWSAEQISAYLKDKLGIHISYELIYQYLDFDRKQGGKLYKLLPHRGEKYKKRN